MSSIKVTYIDHMGTDLSVVNAARVSFGKNREALGTVTVDGDIRQVIHDSDVRLIKYLASHKHISPFGHCFASFHVKAPIFVARQLVKHKFLRWNEISRRYVDSEPELYEPDVWRGKSADKKQGSEGTINQDGYRCDQTAEHFTRISNDNALYLYEHLLGEGVCPEQARMVLPQSTMTEWYWSGSLDAFADMCNLRCKPDTQAETRLVADIISGRMIHLFPVAWEALTDG